MSMASATTASSLLGQRILTVDDDPDILKLLNMRLKAAGYQTMSASNAEEALAQIAINRPALVISDLRMPGMDGLALFDAIHKTDPSLPLIMLTAHGSIPEAVDATQRGVFGFLTKPFDSKSLLQQVEAALRATIGHQHPTQDEAVEDWRK
ncbi:MAG: response regulator, partial [Methylophilaceae bacterium]|nr:response regulator [Methylophilaceae bacterium]